MTDYLKLPLDLSPEMARVHGLAFGDKAWTSPEIYSVLSAPNTFALGAVDKDQLQGFLIFQQVASSQEILTICTDPNFRRNKHANNLIKKMIGLTENGIVSEIFLEVAANNVAAIGLYEQLNFKKIAVRPKYYKQIDGNRLDALVMKLDI